MGLAIPFLWVFCCTYVKLRGLNSQSTFGFVNMSCLLPVCFSLACMFASHWPFSLEAFSSFQWSETTVDLFVSSFWAPVQNMPAPRNQSKDSACLDSVPFAGITVCATCCQVLKGERLIGLPSFKLLRRPGRVGVATLSWPEAHGFLKSYLTWDLILVQFHLF